MNFATGMRTMRAVRDMSQVALSNQAHIALAYLSRAERGHRQMTAGEQFTVRVALDWPEWMDAIIEQLAAGGFVK